MKTLYIERSTGTCRNGEWVENLDLENIERIVVGTGPGSFAGIRSALSFAQGYALGKKCEVLGLPSACAIAAQVFSTSSPGPLAVIGDARQGKLWIALFNGFYLEKDVFQIETKNLVGPVPSDLVGPVPGDYRVTTPDAGRIDELLRETFKERYIGGQAPTEEGLRLFAEACPTILKPEPLPIYLNPAVRPNPTLF